MLDDPQESRKERHNTFFQMAETYVLGNTLIGRGLGYECDMVKTNVEKMKENFD